MLKRMFTILALVLVSAQCADFKDVFDGRETPAKTATHPREKTAKTKKEKPAKITQEAKTQPSSEEASRESARQTIVTKEGTYYFVAAGETLTEIAARYKISAIALAHINDMIYDSTLAVGRRLFIPNKKKLSKYVDQKWLKDKPETAKPEAKSKPASASNWVWPTKVGPVTSGFGRRGGKPHDGIDIGVPSGTPVYATADGEVLYAEYFSSYGNLLLIKHKNGYYSAYAHNQKLLVSKGEKVKQDQQIAFSGKTGRATGPHVHFEIHKRGGAAIDPLAVLPARPNP